MLQAGRRADGRAPEVFVSDFFDFSIYVDAAEADIERWYVERFLALRATVFHDTAAYFHRFADLTDDEADDDRAGHLVGGQRAQPAAEHRAHPVPRPAGAAEGRRPLGPPGPAPQALTAGGTPHRPRTGRKGGGTGRPDDSLG